MIHYHGLPITPETAAVNAIKAGHAFVRFGAEDQLFLAANVCQSFAIDNGAFSSWMSGNPVTDWSDYYVWAQECQRIPSCDFAVIPDVIDGSEYDNDCLVDAWPLSRWFGAPVWHLHESLERLQRLTREWPRVCIGSSGDFAQIKTSRWWGRMSEAMRYACCSEGWPRARLHGLRMMDHEVFTRFPFSSVDSTNIGRNIGIDKNWENGNYQPRTKEARAAVMRERIEHFNAPVRWNFMPVEPEQPAQGALL